MDGVSLLIRRNGTNHVVVVALPNLARSKIVSKATTINRTTHGTPHWIFAIESSRFKSRLLFLTMSVSPSMLAARLLNRSLLQTARPTASLRTIHTLRHTNPSRQDLFASPSLSTTTSALSSSNDSLISLLRREHDEEIEHDSTALPVELSDLQAQLESSGWKVAPNGATTKLVRTLSDNAKVQVMFHVQDNVIDESSMMEEFQQEEEIDPELAPRMRFTVVVTKAGKHMVFTCISEDAQATIENVNVSTSGASVDDILKAGSVDDQQYQGPEFSELAEDLQEAFHTYLQEHVGIGESVASFISMYGDYREQVEYVDFLKAAQDVLK